ncbi:hypothetical protein [Macrococcus armenti]|uniref:hypothetical protein n=1 Tax=Macrococcus armenti TaxID=2875764 RepID=UPI001CCDC43E|nr:hypothetical protein [Macrococcus armenti]UBH09792.1 hypothetical protein LAU41_11875 [Macrococcus armenti]
MKLTYTEIIGSELPIYTIKADDLFLAEEVQERSKEKRYNLVGYLLVDEVNQLYKALYKEVV